MDHSIKGAACEQGLGICMDKNGWREEQGQIEVVTSRPGKGCHERGHMGQVTSRHGWPDEGGRMDGLSVQSALLSMVTMCHLPTLRVDQEWMQHV